MGNILEHEYTTYPRRNGSSDIARYWTCRSGNAECGVRGSGDSIAVQPRGRVSEH